ncbi:hypothetical protein B0H16DRAFT_1733226 [Mycena metata]|uniref:Uncharacterized protein n=1 Tax=Mycena metata TaxID=1033252 RepID=A0AAD7HZJ2_9AGAR|nr:hypothetical protein B0H16DRAFT_1733226 [Mycena metata]
MHTVSFACRDSHFAEPETPPPPVVQLLIHTDFATPPSMVFSIHEDFGSSAQKRVKFADDDSDTHDVHNMYPPLANYENIIGVPKHPSTVAVENSPKWLSGKTETKTIKEFIHNLVAKYLDETKSYKFQDEEALAEVSQQAAQAFPILRKYENDWGTRGILMHRLKNTSNKAARKAAKDVVDIVTDVVKKGKAGKATSMHLRSNKVP